MDLIKLLKNSENIPSRPLLLNLTQSKDKVLLKKLFAQNKIQHITDNYEEQLKEYFEIENPSIVYSSGFDNKFQRFLKKSFKKNNMLYQGRWAYFPWNYSLVHILAEADFFKVRTARNRNLVTLEEQKKFYNTVVGIAGLSVGNSVALAIVLQGGAKKIKLADHDRLALSNTNRIRTNIANLGLLKIELTARQIYEINPYAEVKIFSKGIDQKNVKSFCRGLNIIIDEVDNLAVKYLLREQAKKQRLPLVMAADNGDNGIIDIERYDLNPKLNFFHGRLGKINYQKLIKLDKFNTGKLITKHLGKENVTDRMQLSLAEMGKTLVSWPQLGGAALINGSAVAYCVRKIINGEKLENNRALISLDEKLSPKYFPKKSKNHRKQNIKKLKKVLDF